jgi:lysophospholipase L1-like esterase
VTDGELASALATVTIEIRPVNDAPVAQSRYFEAQPDADLDVTLDATDAEGDPLTFRFGQLPVHGTLTGTPPGLTYAPESGLVGVDSFSFAVSDGEVESDLATVTLAVGITNEAPEVNAGEDRSAALLPWEPLGLDGAATDDGLPRPPGEVTITWSSESAPEGAEPHFADPSSAKTWARFSVPGSYVLGITAADGALTASDEVTVEVSAPTVKIMPLGDSITHGAEDFHTYRYPLWQALSADGYEFDFVGSMTSNNAEDNPDDPDFDVDHEGHSGWTTGMVLDYIEGWAATYQPDLVLIHLGTNDVGGFPPEELIAQAIANLGRIIDVLRAHNSRVAVVLAQIIPCYFMDASIKELNALIQDLAAVKDASPEYPASPVIFVDQWTGFDAGRDTYDSVHPNWSGERKMAEVWYARVVELLGGGNIAPVVGITGPLYGAAGPPGQEIAVAVTAYDTDGSIAKVELRANGELAGELAEGPYAFGWTAASPGEYMLTAVATDDAGATSTSSPVRVSIVE